MPHVQLQIKSIIYYLWDRPPASLRKNHHTQPVVIQAFRSKYTSWPCQSPKMWQQKWITWRYNLRIRIFTLVTVTSHYTMRWITDGWKKEAYKTWTSLGNAVIYLTIQAVTMPSTTSFLVHLVQWIKLTVYLLISLLFLTWARQAYTHLGLVVVLPGDRVHHHWSCCFTRPCVHPLLSLLFPLIGLDCVGDSACTQPTSHNLGTRKQCLSRIFHQHTVNVEEKQRQHLQ